jgi:hypothetical protein
MYAEASKLDPPLLDYAIYKGHLEVQISQVSGRGLFTNQAAKAGDLILYEKVFAYNYNATLENRDTAGLVPRLL